LWGASAPESNCAGQAIRLHHKIAVRVHAEKKRLRQKNLRQKNGGIAGNAAIFLPEIFCLLIPLTIPLFGQIVVVR
jgi:hypothetical protein